jgi:hypothetical protein
MSSHSRFVVSHDASVKRHFTEGLTCAADDVP